jgi:LDH2 family malate/lactate/ureidoglycolate dehydrogenase
MAYYPGEKSEKRINHNTLKSIVTSIFKKCNMSYNYAKTVSESLTNAELRGMHSHDIIRVPEYVKKLREDGVNPKSNPVIISKFGGAIRVDGSYKS